MTPNTDGPAPDANLRPRRRTSDRMPFIRVGARLATLLLAVLASVGSAAEVGPTAAEDVPTSTRKPAAGERSAASKPSRPWYVAIFDHDDGPHETEHSHHHRTWEPARELDPSSVEGYQHMIEVTQYPHDEPTAEQRRRADELVAKCIESAKRNGWYDFEKARRDGFKLMFADKEHYANARFATDDRILDPDRPEFLMYYDVGGEMRLGSFMFLARTLDEHGPQVGGPLTVWHLHLWRRARCLLHGLYPGGETDRQGLCKVGTPSHRSPEMLHVWLLDRPEGRFATHMTPTTDFLNQLKNQPATP